MRHAISKFVSRLNINLQKYTCIFCKRPILLHNWIRINVNCIFLKNCSDNWRLHEKIALLAMLPRENTCRMQRDMYKHGYHGHHGEGTPGCYKSHRFYKHSYQYLKGLIFQALYLRQIRLSKILSVTAFNFFKLYCWQLNSR